MENLVQGIEKLVHDAAIVQVNGKSFSVHGMRKVIDSTEIIPIDLNTLTGLRDYIAGEFDSLEKESMFIVVSGYDKIKVYISADKESKIRQNPISVSLDKSGKDFPFGQFMAVDDFIIRLNSTFVVTNELREVLSYASKLVVKNSIHTDDDGISQNATVKRGVSTAMLEQKTAPSRVILCPHRTFTEIEQPSSPFVFRMKVSGESLPLCSLFEADGGAWKVDAGKSIKQWISENVNGVVVIA